MDDGGPARRLSHSGEAALLSDPAAAAALLDEQRRTLLALLAEPGSATSVARELGLPRQKVNYHLRELERLGLLRLVEERRKGNCTERIVRATATHYIVDPGVLGALGSGESAPEPDRFSWAYLVAVSARIMRELAVVSRRAKRAGKRLQTFTLHADVRFRDAAALGAFTDELSREVARLIARHASGTESDGRVFRFVVGAYPAITKQEDEEYNDSSAEQPAPEDPT